MLGNLKPQAPDKILALMGEFKADPRQGKIDLGVGVYKDASGHTPIMRAVRAAEQRMLETETTKTYAGLSGEPDFQKAMAELILGDLHKPETTAALATVGGTGAIRQALELARMANPDLRVFVSDPTWPNHVSIMNFMGLPVQTYRYFDAESRGVDFEGMKADISAAKKGDVVLLHGCCHNPTGANLTLEQWAEVAGILERTGALPLIDLAYQGFGDGLEEDASVVRLFASLDLTMLISSSFSKSFSLYGERVGALTLVTSSQDESARVLSQLKRVIRTNYSNPPTHGGMVVSAVLNTPELHGLWVEELAEMRDRIHSVRTQLVEKLKALNVTQDFDFVLAQRGMFSYSGLSAEQVERLRVEHGVYAVSSGRICVAALNSGNIDYVANAIAQVL